MEKGEEIERSEAVFQFGNACQRNPDILPV